MSAEATPCEFWEAQSRSYIDWGWSQWMRLGGRTLVRAREAVALAKGSSQSLGRMIGRVDSEYRIRHFVGTVETVE